MAPEIKLAAAISDIPMPDRFKKLPINDKGFPIPAFVAWLAADGQNYLPANTYGAKRDFRIIDPHYMDGCYRFHRCWLCNEPLGRHRVFAIGPMCVVNRVTMEPPSHRDCAEYAVRACPFLSQPKMVRNEKNMPIDRRAPGLMIERNPGVTCLYETETYKRFTALGGKLCELGEPKRIEWWAEGRIATRAEVSASIDSGMPLLMREATKDGPDAIKALAQCRARAEKFLPAE
jgi:hypothetical protein